MKEKLFFVFLLLIIAISTRAPLLENLNGVKADLGDAVEQEILPDNPLEDIQDALEYESDDDEPADEDNGSTRTNSTDGMKVKLIEIFHSN